MGKFGIGQPVRRIEDQRLLRGHGRYNDDISLLWQAYAAILRSPHAHAEILNIDAQPAIRPKSNWANTIDEPPFEVYGVTCGITFTFGGLRINPRAQVIDTDGHIIPGLHAAGELVGGLFYHNYPSAAGLTSGAVFGRIAGATAAGANA